MTLHTWRAIIGACLCTGLLSGCTPSLFGLRCFGPAKAGEGATVVADEQSARKGVGPPEDRSAEGPDERLTDGSIRSRSIYHETIVVPRDPAIRDGKLGAAGFELPVPADVKSVAPPSPDATLLPLPKPPPDVKAANPPAPGPAPPEPLVAALTCLLKTPPTEDALKEAMGHLKRYNPATEELFMRILPILADLSRNGVDKMKAEEIAVLQEQVQALLISLRTHSELVIDTMCFVSKLDGPGAYKPQPVDHQFRPRCGDMLGEEALIYIELRNVGSIRQGSCYETRLSSQVEICDGAGKREYTYNLKGQSRPLRSPILCSECSRGYSFYVPHIPPGKYTLTIAVKDETSSPPRVARKSLDFLVSPGNVAAN